MISLLISFQTIIECQDLDSNSGEQVLINVLIFAFCWSFGGALQVILVARELVKQVCSNPFWSLMPFDLKTTN